MRPEIGIYNKFRSAYGQPYFNAVHGINMSVDGSVTPVAFDLLPDPDGNMIVIDRITFNLSVAGSPRLDGFGNGAALTNGISYFASYLNNEDIDFTFTRNEEFADFGPISKTEFQGQRTLLKIVIDPVNSQSIMNFGGSPPNYARITINDDLTLVSDRFTCFVQGYYIAGRGSA